MLRVRHLPEPEAAYVAGIIDGEGTITLTRLHRRENRRALVSISSTELPLLQYFLRSAVLLRLKARGCAVLHSPFAAVRQTLSAVGAGRITGKVTARTHHSPSFTYAISSRRVLALLSQIAPYRRT